MTEAGGCVTLDNGSTFDLTKGNIIASCDKNINQGLIDVIREADQSSLHIT